MHLHIMHKYILQFNKLCISTEMWWTFIWSQNCSYIFFNHIYFFLTPIFYGASSIRLHLSVADGKISSNENNTCIITSIILKKSQSGHREVFCKSSLHQGITQIFFVYAIRCIKVVALSPWYSIFQHRWIHFWSNIVFECTNVGHSPKIKQNALSH